MYLLSRHARGSAVACGVAPDLIKALLADIETAPLEATMKPILRYAKKLTLSPARMTDADAAAVYDAGWGDDALYSTVLVTALFNFYNRLVDGVGLDLPEGYVPEAAKRLSTQGYDVFARMAQT
jgi:alkylhydroperoxidase family enzyme